MFYYVAIIIIIFSLRYKRQHEHMQIRQYNRVEHNIHYKLLKRIERKNCTS